MIDSLFVYGTLHPDRAPEEIADVARKLQHVSTGTMQGKVYDLGEYPGAVLSDNPADKVKGNIFRLPPDPAALQRLDEYEYYSPTDPENSLYKRVVTEVSLPDGKSQSCWVYIYNRPQDLLLKPTL